MAALARQDQAAPSLQWLSGEIRYCGSIDSALRALWRYEKDPPGVEYVASPDLQIVRACAEYEETGVFNLWGDCDEAATLAASLLLFFGAPARLVAIRKDGDVEFSHVFLRWSGGDIDPTVPAEMLPLWDYAEQIELDV
jgi:hypothetical protein